ncbi:hypothetical protein SAMN05444387_3986 [Flavobacterium pectinovorum]|uniref:Uncharacterized protein n=2 Tax=Flavobacterium pectinovorum TaxID=29533 RepID=A0AB36NUI1_9FLAO|nr:hypothetical protein B0A72_21790 [Flavobacterium pectinovorum]SHN07744.1 hypothetical protein SAMN05444387_3986 [Flavobacterium pectinovorum]
MKTKHFCMLGLLFFVISYLLFSKVLPDFQSPIDFAHWFNLIGACFLFSFNDVFPKNRLNSFASFVTTLGVVAHIGLCTIDFIMSSYGTNDLAKEELSRHISNVPSILYPFVIVGPSLLFIGLSLHALNFIKTNVISFLMVFLSSLAIGFSFFILKNGVYMFSGCVVFVLGLAFLLNRKENQNEQFDK